MDAVTGEGIEGIREATIALTGEGSKLVLVLNDFDMEIRNLKPGEGYPDDRPPHKREIRQKEV